MRCSTHQALNGESKSFSTEETSGIDTDLYKVRLEFQMKGEMNLAKISIDHVQAISTSDVARNKRLRGAFIWINTQAF